LGPYEIVGWLGSGGMGDVFKGYDAALDRYVAIKVLPAELARQEDFVARFRVEATAAARVEHPNIVPIYTIGSDAGHHFFAMQFVAGQSLAQRLAVEPRPQLSEVISNVQQVLAGLAAAHERGLVHRDIKPSNILLNERGERAMLADFGLVKSASAGTAMTATGVIMGTVDYISPEQGRGKPVDGRSDLYSIGVLMYQMLAGRLPFVADSPTAMIFQHA
jgi:serine/threonine protein kinase